MSYLNRTAIVWVLNDKNLGNIEHYFLLVEKIGYFKYYCPKGEYQNRSLCLGTAY